MGNRLEITVLPIFLLLLRITSYLQSVFCFAAEHTKSSWFVAATTFILKSQIDEFVLCIISDVFAAVEICATAK